MGDPLRFVRNRLSAGLVLGVLMAMPTQAYAGDDDEETEKPKRRGLIVTVEDNEDVDAGKKPKKQTQSSTLSPPDTNAPESEINAYLRDLKKDVRDTQAAMKDASRAGDADEAMRLKEELRDKKALLKDEESRLKTKDVGLIAGGAVLTGLGGLSLLTSVILICGYGLSALDGDPDDEYGWASLGTLGGGVLGLSAGIPMIVVGNKRQTRGAADDEETYGLLPPATGHRPAVGITMSFSF